MDLLEVVEVDQVLQELVVAVAVPAALVELGLLLVEGLLPEVLEDNIQHLLVHLSVFLHSILLVDTLLEVVPVHWEAQAREELVEVVMVVQQELMQCPTLEVEAAVVPHIQIQVRQEEQVVPELL
jgi:hypothetical protein